MKKDIESTEDSLLQAQNRLDAILNSEEPCKKIAKLEACIAEERALALPIRKCLVDLKFELIHERNKLLDHLAELKAERDCLAEMKAL